MTEQGKPRADVHERQALLRHLEGMDLEQRIQALKRFRTKPLKAVTGRGLHNTLNLRLIVLAAQDPQRILVGYISRRLGWDGMNIKNILRWGQANGWMREVSGNCYALEQGLHINLEPITFGMPVEATA